MPIDEAVLDQTISDLKAKLDVNEDEGNKLRGVLSAISHIQKVNGKVIGDRGTNQPMSDERRQEIYDACKPQADAILA